MCTAGRRSITTERVVGPYSILSLKIRGLASPVFLHFLVLSWRFFFCRIKWPKSGEKSKNGGTYGYEGQSMSLPKWPTSQNSLAEALRQSDSASGQNDASRSTCPSQMINTTSAPAKSSATGIKRRTPSETEGKGTKAKRTFSEENSVMAWKRKDRRGKKNIRS